MIPILQINTNPAKPPALDWGCQEEDGVKNSEAGPAKRSEAAANPTPHELFHQPEASGAPARLVFIQSMYINPCPVVYREFLKI
jgi:hypothetical protein